MRYRKDIISIGDIRRSLNSGIFYYVYGTCRHSVKTYTLLILSGLSKGRYVHILKGSMFAQDLRLVSK